jgi:hypothetical protein
VQYSRENDCRRQPIPLRVSLRQPAIGGDSGICDYGWDEKLKYDLQTSASLAERLLDGYQRGFATTWNGRSLTTFSLIQQPVCGEASRWGRVRETNLSCATYWR